MAEETETDDPVLDKARDLLTNRQQAYHLIFGEKKSVHAERILDDLARFCRANVSTYHPDARIHAVLEGRREVWLRIQDHLKLQAHELEQKTFSKWGINGSNNKRTDKRDTTKYTSGTAEQFTSEHDDHFLASDS